MITNKRIINLYATLYSFGILTELMLLLVVNFTHLLPMNSHLQLILLAFIFIFLISLIQLKYTQYEFMGECISIRTNHPWNGKFLKPYIEFPKDYLKDFKINKAWLSKSIILTIESGRDSCKEIKQNIKLSGFTSLQIIEIENSLLFVKENIYNKINETDTNKL